MLHPAVPQVEQLTEVPGGLLPSLHIDGLDQPMSLALRQSQDVLRMKVSCIAQMYITVIGDRCMPLHIRDDMLLQQSLCN